MIYTVTLNPALDKEYCVSELLPNAVLRAYSVNLDYGGKGFNIARMLAAFGSDCIALGFVGGHTGEVLQTGLQGIGLRTDFVQVSGETRTNISIVSDREGDYFKVNEAGPDVSDREVAELLGKIEDLVQPQDWWVLAGSLPRGVPDDIYARMIERIHQGGAKAVLDSSGAAFRLGCEAGPFLIKPNREEIAQISSGEVENPTELYKAIAGIHEIGVENIVLSAGKEKSICSNGVEIWVGVPPKVDEKNPIGAGDAMLAAVVERLSRGAGWGEAFTWGIAAGSAAASLRGTSMPTRPQVEKLLNKVMIRKE